MTKHDRHLTSETLDSLLLDVATQIELSPADRRVAENRYRRLKEHLERSTSPLASLLLDGEGMIYAQGSMATSTTVIDGADDDRFDVDAIVEINVPSAWPADRPLDVLEEALQTFQGAQKIERCTRCVQLQFPFMHMDVSIMDRSERIAIERAGEIFHSPDEGGAYRVPANPWGFTRWFREMVAVEQAEFVQNLDKRREALSRRRLTALDDVEKALAKTDQVDLPRMVPSAVDAQQSVALKLLKRYLNLRYEALDLKRPPSIYLALRAASIGYYEEGLSAQLIVLARSTAQILREHLATHSRPHEVNPTYRPDVITDRWPAEGANGRKDMAACAEALEHLDRKLCRLAVAPLTEICEEIDKLFGERVGAAIRKITAARFDRRTSGAPNLIQPATGAVLAPAVARPAQGSRQVREHNFHPLTIPKKRWSR